MVYLKVKYLTIGKMLSIHFTKQSQGAVFRKFRAEVQGICCNAIPSKR